MKNLFLSAGFLLTLAACNTTKLQEEALNKVTQMHDSVMVLSGSIPFYEQKIDAALDSLKKLGKTDSALLSIKEKLGKADRKMSNWMEKFDIEYGLKNSAEKTAVYFKNQFEQIEKIGAETKEAIQAAKDKHIKP